MTAFEDFVNRELPRRPVMLTSTITGGYQDDPNDAGAPDLVKNAPAGAFYLEADSLSLWRKTQDAAGTWVVTDVDPRVILIEPVTVPVDYNDVTAVDPPTEINLNSQNLIDGYLADNGATAFKHVRAIWDALPFIVPYDITINFAGGVQRPRATETDNVAFSFANKIFVEGAGAVVNGAGISTWSDLYAGLSVTAYADGNDNPYIDVSGTPFVAGELKGKFLHVTNNDEVHLIHDNTTSRVYVLDDFNSAPTVVDVKAKPDTVLRNSLTDVGGAAEYSTTIFLDPNVEINDLTLDGWGYNYGTVLEVKGDGPAAGRISSRILIDHRTYADTTGLLSRLQNGFVLRLVAGTYWRVGHFSVIVPTDLALRRSGLIGQCLSGTLANFYGYGGIYFEGSDKGVVVEPRGGFVAGTIVMERVGHPTLGDANEPGLVAVYGGRISIARFAGYNKENEFRQFYAKAANPNQAALLLSERSLIEDSYFWIKFTDNEVNCVRVLDYSSILDGRFLDGGGNDKYGMRVEGSHVTLSLSSTVDVAGALGEVVLPDGTVDTYANIQASPVVDLTYFTRISQDT